MTTANRTYYIWAPDLVKIVYIVYSSLQQPLKPKWLTKNYTNNVYRNKLYITYMYRWRTIHLSRTNSTVWTVCKMPVVLRLVQIPQNKTYTILVH
jgi:hypothetical protein